jgi:hypothetical protein
MATTGNANQAYRRRIVEAGEQEVLIRLSNETVALMDTLKARYGLRNRGQVIEQPHSAREMLKLLTQRRVAAQQQ